MDPFQGSLPSVRSTYSSSSLSWQQQHNLFEYPAKSKNQCVIVVMLFLEVVVEKLRTLLSKHECIQISGTALADVLQSNLSLCKKH